MRELGRWMALPSRRKALLVEALLLVSAVRATLSVVPYRRRSSVLRRLDRMVPESARRTTPDDAAWAVSRASRLVPGASCLTRAIALELLVGRDAGTGVVFRIGVRRGASGGIEGHAWIETHRGPVRHGDVPGDFTPLGSWRPAGAASLRVEE